MGKRADITIQPEARLMEMEMVTHLGINGTDENGNTVPVDGVITIDRGILVLYLDLRASQRSGRPTGDLSNNMIAGSDQGAFIALEAFQIQNFMSLVLGHETAHFISFMNGLPEGPAGNGLERGEMYEIATRGIVTGHTVYGYAVYKAFRKRLYQSGTARPYINNISNAQLDAQLRAWMLANYGTIFILR